MMDTVVATLKEQAASFGTDSIDCDTLVKLVKALHADVTEEQAKAIFAGAGGDVGAGGAVTIEALCAYLSGEAAPARRPIFFDMKHSNNAARIRLWLMLKDGVRDKVDTKTLTYPELKSEEFTRINPLQKVPGFLRDDGVPIFESAVILNYLEDEYADHMPSFKPAAPKARQHMDLQIRIHDLYIASPNCTAPGFSHSQGAMYLSYGWHGAARGMDLPTRAAKLAEIWKQLTWLDSNVVGPYLAADVLSLSDLTWFPTTIFMEYMLPRVFGWPEIFRDTDGPFPALATWWLFISGQSAFSKVRQEIWEYWEELDRKGQFQPIIDEIVADTSGLKFRYP